MSKIFLLALIIITRLYAFNQEKTANIGNKDENLDVIFEDNPSIIPKLEINIQPLTIGLSPKSFFAFHLEPRYRLSNNFSLSIPVTVPYWKSKYKFRFNQPYTVTTLILRTLDLNIMGHYKLKSKDKLKKESIKVGGLFIWENLNRKKRHTTYIDFGLGYYNTGSNFSFTGRSSYKRVRINGGHIESISAIIGLSLEKSKSIRIKVDSVSFSQFRIKRFYTNLSLGFINNFEVYGPDLKPITEKHLLELLKYVPFGWRMAYTYQKSIKNSSNAFTFGVEFGHLIGYKQLGIKPLEVFTRTIDYNKYSNLIHFNLRFGISIGGKTKFTKK